MIVLVTMLLLPLELDDVTPGDDVTVEFELIPIGAVPGIGAD